MYKGVSLHIGVNKLSTDYYRSEGILCSPENDARAMAELAGKEGYSEINILTTEEATAENFKRYFSHCAETLSTGDTFLLTFSGHGGQQDDADAEELDGKDETWCFYDTRLVDDEIGRFWKEFKPGVRIIVVSANCHSRSCIRPYPISLPFWKSGPPAGTAVKPVVYMYPPDPRIRASILHLSACDDRQQARDGERFSRFTALLLKAWNGGHFKGGYEDLVHSINKEAGYLQTCGLAMHGVEDPDFLNAMPFKLLTNKTINHAISNTNRTP